MICKKHKNKLLIIHTEIYNTGFGDGSGTIYFYCLKCDKVYQKHYEPIVIK